MRARELLRILKDRGCVVVSRESSHIKVRCGECVTTVPDHKGEDIKKGTLHAIQRQLERCLGKGWLTGR